MVPWSAFELHWEVPPCVLLPCLSPPVGPPPGSLHRALPTPVCKRKWFVCPKSPSGLVIPVDGVELAGSFVSELEDRLAGSCCLPRAGDIFAERPPFLLGVSISALSLLPQGGHSRQAGSRLHLTWALYLAGLSSQKHLKCQETVSVEPQP